MYHYEQVMKGLTKFIDVELVPKMSGLQKWAFGTACGIALKRGEDMFHQFKNHELLKTLQLVDGDKINVDEIYVELKKQAHNSPIEINVPMIGCIKLNHSDVETLHSYIVSA